MRPGERELHAAVAAYLRVALRPPTTWTTFPAGGGGLERGKMLARLGLRAGWPDILVLHPLSLTIGNSSLYPRACVVVGIELKTADGRQSQAQREVAAEFDLARATYAVCRSIEDVENELRRAGVPARASAGLRLSRAAA